MPDERPRQPDEPVSERAADAAAPAPAEGAAPSEGSEAAAGAEDGSPASLASALDTPNSDAAEAYHRRARLAEDRLEEVLGAYRRLKHENEQYRDRVTRNVERRFAERRELLVLRFIDILDNLDRALEASERSYATESLIDGLIMVRSQLLQTLRDEGLERVPVLGLPFDPETSEAVETRRVENADHHHLVVAEMLRGYRFEGNIVRPARVVVGEFSEDEPVAAARGGGAARVAPRSEANAGGQDAEADSGATDDEAQDVLFPDLFDDEDGANDVAGEAGEEDPKPS